MNVSDQKLLNAIANKNQPAFNEFYKRYSGFLYEWTFKKIGDEKITEDIQQEFWSHFWQNPETIKTDANESAKSFLFRFYMFRTFDYLRKIKKKNRFTEIEKLPIQQEQTNNLSYSHVLEELQAKEIVSIINDIVSCLPELTQEIFDYRWNKNLSAKETAEKLNIDEKTVYNRMFRTLNEIRTRLNDDNAKHKQFYYETGIWIVFLSIIDKLLE